MPKFTKTENFDFDYPCVVNDQILFLSKTVVWSVFPSQHSIILRSVNHNTELSEGDVVKDGNFLINTIHRWLLKNNVTINKLKDAGWLIVQTNGIVVQKLI
jgi:hypothetical protein